MRATGTQRDSALYFDEMGASKVPVGFGRDGQPVFVNFEFVDGTRGAHVSISGVSGIATKTSFAMFLLHSITNCGVLAGEAHNTKVLVFSVKGEDLLFLDYANSRLTAAQRALYARLGLPAAPFGNVRVFAPPRRDDPAGTPDVSARDRAVSPFYWTLAEFCADELLPFVFADAEDERAQYTMLIGQVAARLRRDAVPAGDEGAIRVRGVDSGQRQDHPHLRRPDHVAGSRARRRRHARVLGGREHRDRQRQRAAAQAAVRGQAVVRGHPRGPGPSR